MKMSEEATRDESVENPMLSDIVNLIKTCGYSESDALGMTERLRQDAVLLGKVYKMAMMAPGQTSAFLYSLWMMERGA